MPEQPGHNEEEFVPKGAMLLTTLFLLVVIAAFAYLYIDLIVRS